MTSYQFFFLAALIWIAPHTPVKVAQGISAANLIAAIVFFILWALFK